MFAPHPFRKLAVALALVLALVMPTSAVFAQSTPDQVVPQVPTDMSTLFGTEVSVPNGVVDAEQLRQSLSAEQLSGIQAVLDSHAAQLKRLASELAALGTPDVVTPGAQDTKLFLPLIGVPATADKAEADTQAAGIKQISMDLAALQAKIDREIMALLTADQQALYSKYTADLQSVGKTAVAGLNPTGDVSASSSSDCFYGAIYGAYAYYYAYWAEYYSWLNSIYYGDSYAMAGYFGAILTLQETRSGLPLAGGAYYDVYYGRGWDSNYWADDAYYDFLAAEDYGYRAYYWNWYSGYYGSYYGGIADDYSYYAYLYSYYSESYLYSCN